MMLLPLPLSFTLHACVRGPIKYRKRKGPPYNEVRRPFKKKVVKQITLLQLPWSFPA